MAKKISISQYIGDEKLNKDKLAYTSVIKRITENRPIPHVKKTERFNERYYVLHVAE